LEKYNHYLNIQYLEKETHSLAKLLENSTGYDNYLWKKFQIYISINILSQLKNTINWLQLSKEDLRSRILLEIYLQEKHVLEKQ
jgi:hypothetical protein